MLTWARGFTAYCSLRYSFVTLNHPFRPQSDNGPTRTPYISPALPSFDRSQSEAWELLRAMLILTEDESWSLKLEPISRRSRNYVCSCHMRSAVGRKLHSASVLYRTPNFLISGSCHVRHTRRVKAGRSFLPPEWLARLLCRHLMPSLLRLLHPLLCFSAVKMGAKVWHFPLVAMMLMDHAN